MLKADYLFLLTDVDCLYTDNPRTNPDAKPVSICHDIQVLREQVSVASRGSALGTGGMMTKLIAADLATAAGVRTVIARGSKPENITQIIEADARGVLVPESKVPAVVQSAPVAAPLHTLFTAKDNPLYDRKWWIQYGLHTAGRVHVDRGAVKAVLSKKQRSSLFAAGIIEVEGHFNAHQAIEIVAWNDDTEKLVIGKGLVNYSSHEIERIKRCKSSEIPTILGYVDAECVIHRENLVRLVDSEE